VLALPETEGPVGGRVRFVRPDVDLVAGDDLAVTGQGAERAALGVWSYAVGVRSGGFWCAGVSAGGRCRVAHLGRVLVVGEELTFSHRMRDLLREVLVGTR